MRTQLAIASVLFAIAGCGEVRPDFTDAALPGCDEPADCASGICDEVCVETQEVPCTDVAPPDATSDVVDVTITFDEATGWSEPAACAWTCDPGFCRAGEACVLDAGVIEYDPGPVGSRWFGGDDRDVDGDGTPDFRSVGDGQSLVILTSTTISHVGLYFTSPFVQETTGTPHDTDVRVEVRNSAGGRLGWGETTVPASFSDGWVYFPISVTLGGDATYILTAYVPGVWTGQNYSSGVRMSFADGFSGGTAYIADVRGATPGDLSNFAIWSIDQSSDMAFRLVRADGCEPP